MSRRRQSITVPLAAGDPGKDLFAYLFLLIMVFAFMVLMSIEQKNNTQQAPDQKKQGKSRVTQILKKNIGTLEDRDGKIYLKFDQTIYDPVKDLHRLVQDKRIVISHPEGKEKQQFLYIEKKNQETISLFDYLETFQKLSQKNITIAFAEELL